MPKDFYTDEQRLIRDIARDIAHHELKPHAAQWERDGRIAESAIFKLGDSRLLGLLIPDEWGGAYSDWVA
jgi:alkylation response protein AidB-like acyl-CoA dehydrogenase